MNTDMISFEELVQNDDFIKWATGKESSNSLYWDNLRNELIGNAKEDFESAINSVSIISGIDINKGFRKQSTDRIESNLFKLHNDANKLYSNRVFNLNVVLKYAAVILLFISIGYISYLQLNKTKDIFDNHLVQCDFVTNKILIETGDGTFYEMPNKPMKWITDEGISINVSDNKITMLQTKEYVSTKSTKYKIHVPYRKQYEAVLVDDSRVKLNANTVFEFDVNPNTEKREVRIVGEGYFEVAHNPLRPFIVTADKVNIKVLGTGFNVTAYKNENIVETTLIHGSVKVTNTINKQFKIIKPGEVAVLNRASGELSIDNANLNETMLWVSEVMILNNNKLEDICDQLARWYGVYFEYDPLIIKDLRFSGELRKDMELNSILEKMHYTENIKYVVDNKTIHLTKQ